MKTGIRGCWKQTSTFFGGSSIHLCQYPNLLNSHSVSETYCPGFLPCFTLDAGVKPNPGGGGRVCLGRISWWGVIPGGGGNAGAWIPVSEGTPIAEGGISDNSSSSISSKSKRCQVILYVNTICNICDIKKY